MKKLKLIMVMALSLAVVISCTDNSLDPLQFSNMKKGTILALRGTQLQNIYVNGVPGATIVPKLMTGTETFTFDTELLAQDKSSLASVDVFVIKGSGANTSRVNIQNVPASAFKSDGTYLGPWATITLKINDVLTGLGLPVATDPIYKTDAPTNPILTTYKSGILFECDINLTNGTKILAADIIAAGLFQSNQFYPAMKLSWTILNYCSYNATSWAGNWIGTEVGACCGGDDANTLVQDLVNPNKFTMDNFFGYPEGAIAYVVFTPSTNLSDQIMAFPTQTVVVPSGKPSGIVNSPGTYDQCKGVFSAKVTFNEGSSQYVWVYNFVKAP